MYKFIENDLKKQQKEMEEWYAATKERCAIASDVTILEDLPYGKAEKDCHKMDIYYPKASKGKLPVIFDFHGGGLLLCDRKVNQWFCSEMAKRGFLVFCIEYPLVPESDVYGILKDSYQGIEEAFQKITLYGGDPERIYLCGDSAGGFISTYLAAIQNSENIAESLEIQRSEIRIQATAAISGMFYSSHVDKQGIFVLRQYFYGKKCKKHPFWKYVNPENPEVLESQPPMFSVTSQGDYLRDYTLKFVDAMRKKGKKILLKDYESRKDLEHDFVCLKPDCKEAQEMMDQIAEFFNRY